MESIEQELAPLRERLINHEIYERLGSDEVMKRFMEHHIFAVWDFMSLLKALQREITCLDEAWIPKSSGAARRLINEIVVGEESDEIDGAYTSHFEMYLEGMRQVGCSSHEIQAVLARVTSGVDIMTALNAAPSAARQFCRTTFTIVRGGSLPAIAAAFTLGREDVIPAMFTEMLVDLQETGRAETSIFISYLKRHIELDSAEHGPMAESLLSSICGEDDAKWHAARLATEQALRARLCLWDGALRSLGSRELHAG